MSRIVFATAITAALLAACSSDKSTQTLVSTTTEQPGANCPAGGVAIASGHDDNKDGTLQSTEVDQTSYVCQPADAPTQLGRADDEPEGSNCLHGGSAIHSGLDTDHDGILADAEITTTSYVCNGDDGTSAANALIRIDAEPANGGHCAARGQAIKTGLDTN